MGHYSKVVDGKVVNTIVADEDFFETFIDDSPGEWVKTSYNTRGGVHYEPNSETPSSDQSKALRKNYGAKGLNYDGIGFYGDKPFASWTLNADKYWWEAPITRPNIVNIEDEDGNLISYHKLSWDETLYQSDNTKGWTSKKYNIDGSAHADADKIYDWNGTAWIERE